MHSVDLLDETISLVRSAGFDVRQQWLGESNGGACRIGSQWVVFINLTLPADEQLQGLIMSLRRTGETFDTSHCSDWLKKRLAA
jgi:hypothetical protein